MLDMYGSILYFILSCILRACWWSALLLSSGGVEYQKQQDCRCSVITVLVSFELVNILQNCTRLRRLVWTSVFLRVDLFFFFFYLTYFVWFRSSLMERAFFGVSHSHLSTKLLCVKCTFFSLFFVFCFFLNWWFERFHFEICADLPPGRHTTLYRRISEGEERG